MTVRDMITALESSGVQLATDGKHIIVTPAGRLTDEQRDFLKAHKRHVIDILDPRRRKIREGVAAVYQRLELDRVPFVEMTEAVKVTGQAVDDAAIALMGDGGSWPAFTKALQAWELAWREAAK